MEWNQRPTRERVADLGRVEIWSESTGRYRVTHYLVNPEVYFALVRVNTGTRTRKWEQIGRFDSLAAAQAECGRKASVAASLGELTASD